MNHRLILFVWALAFSLVTSLAQAVTCSANMPPASNPDSAYTDNGDGTVTHAPTGLTWKRCAEGQTWSGGTCSGSASNHTWAQALTQAVNSSSAGITDWRLPDIKELRSLVEECRTNPSINNSIFPNTPASYFWSGSPIANYSYLAWRVDFDYGYASDNNRSNGLAVRLVRGGQSFGSSDTTAPSVPSGLAGSAVGSSQINLSWNAATDNVGVTAYKVYRNSVLIATLGNVTSYSNTGLSASTSYSYTVAACDAAGNCSSQSVAASATTAGVTPTFTPPSHVSTIIYGFDQPGPFYNLDTYVTINNEPTTSISSFGFYSMYQFQFQNGVVGYMGLQKDDGQGKKAIFSIWDGANVISANPVASNCVRFGHEGSGTMCLQPFQWVVGHEYRIRIWTLGVTGNDETWGAFVQDTVTGVETFIGSIKLSTNAGFTGYGRLINSGVGVEEYYGGGSYTCNTLPYFSFTRRGPYADNNAYSASSANIVFPAYGNAFPYFPCTNSNVTTTGRPYITQEAGGSVVRTASSTNAWSISAPVLTATAASSSQINLTWTGSSAINAYKVYRAGALIATLGNVTSYSDTGLNASTSYSYTVQACDTAGNCSVQSSAASATTAAVLTPPVCTLSANPSAFTVGGSSTLTASCTPAASSYTWTGGTCAGTTGSTCTVTPTTTTNYTVKGTNAGGTGAAAGATVTVNACAYALGTSSASVVAFASTGNVTGNVSVTSSCAWTATSNVSWITITSGASGSGNGNVVYAVEANTSTSSRTGTLTIAGQTFTVTQTGIYTLSVTQSGTGSGAVSSSPTGISCSGSSTCSAFFSSGTSVTLTATPATGSTFTGWSGACTGTGTCTVSMSAARSVTATFASAVISRYTDNGDGTVTDPNTGLTWMRCAMGQTWTGSICTGAASTYTFDQANALTGMVTFASQSDWRVPNVRELQTIVDRSVYNPAIDSVAFPNVPGSLFWSGSLYVVNSNYAWVVNFGNGNADSVSYRGYSREVRLVRGGQSFGSLLGITRPTSDYVDNGNGTVTHTPTNLTWKRCPELQTWTGSTCSGTATTFTFDQATALADTTTFAGQSDWRLPTEDELLSLVDYSTYGPAINSSIFPATPSSYFWSGSTNAYDSNYAWGVYFNDGYAGYNNRSNSSAVRLVRGGQSFGSFVLAVSKGGTGTGTVSAADINCGSTCSASLASGTSVTLTATPASGSTFTGWSGSCSGAGSCTVSMNAVKSVTATFNLNVTAPVCTLSANPSSFTAGGSSTLTASCTPAATSYTWTGGTCAGTTAATCTVTPTATTTYSVTGTNAGGTGAAASATVTVNACAYTLGASSASVSASASTGSISVASSCAWTATSNASWMSITSGASGSGNGSVGYTVVANTSGSARTGTLTIAGQTFTVTQAAAVPVCTLSASSSSITVGSSSTLTASCNPAATSYTWIGGACAGTTAATCTVTPTSTTTYSVTGTNAGGTGAAASVTVSTISTYTLSVTKSGAGSGTVTSSPSGISCGSTCSASLTSGTSVTLTATPATGSTLTGWSGACSGMGSCTVSVTADKSVTASFGVARYTDNADGTVSDPNTGLTWMRCSMGQVWNGSTCLGTAVTYTFDQASALSGTTTFANQSDWRMPNIRELQTIVDRSVYDPAIDSVAFPNTPSSLFWSGSPYAYSSSVAWIINFGYGYVGNDYRDSGNAVRLVRGSQSFGSLLGTTRPTSDYVDSGNGTVTHTPTNLTWKRCPELQAWTGSTCSGTATTFTFDQATALADTTTFAGQSDWRLPTEDELLSLVDYGTYGQAINSSIFPATPGSNFWSGSPYVGNSGYAWYVDFYDGYANGYYRGSGHAIRLVRGGQPSGTYVLAVSKSGTGAGTVTGSSAGINCGSMCSASITSGTSVTLTAIPASGSTFSGWSGSCSGTGSCTVGMNAVKSVTATFTLNVTAPVCTLSANPSSFTTGGSSTLTASCTPAATSYTWTGGSCAGTTAATCTVTPTATTTYTVAGVNAGGIGVAASATVTVNACTYGLGTSSASVAASASTGSVSVTSSCAWTATSNASWLSITSGASGSGNGSVGYTVVANTSGSARTGTLTIAGQTFTVTQGIFSPACTLSANPPSFTVGGSSTLTASCTPAASSYAWTGGTCTGTTGATCTVTPTSTTTYSVTGTNAGGTGAAASATVTVNACTYGLGTSSASVSASANTGSISVTSLCAWTATSNASWITITSGSSGSGNGTVAYAVAANTGTTMRIGTLTIAGQTVTVTQAAGSTVAAPVCSLSANPPSITSGGSSTLTATCNPAATSYIWTGGTCAGTSGASCTVSPTATTTYSVQGSNAGGTNQAASATVTVTANTASYTVPGTLGNDVFVLTAGNSYYGGAGNDTFIISPNTLRGDVTAKIIDSEGDNLIQLVDGMTVTASSFYSDAAQLTLSNGANVQILGASKFNFQLGANALAGDTAAVLTYSQFVSSLGASLSGTLPASGTAGYVVPTGFTQASVPVPSVGGSSYTVPGTLGDDVLAPSGGNSYLGGGGNDVYIISPYTLSGAVTAKIIDSEGSNVIQLVGGLTIASSTFYSNAVQLTLSNGASMQILGASGFSYQLGANAPAGVTATSLSYAQFAAALGASVPAGASAVNGSANFVVPSP